MTQNRTIKILVPRAGLSKGQRTIQLQTEGFQGETCKNAAEAFQKAMGLKVMSEELTSEFYETQPNQREFTSEGGGG